MRWFCRGSCSSWFLVHVNLHIECFSIPVRLRYRYLRHSRAGCGCCREREAHGSLNLTSAQNTWAIAVKIFNAFEPFHTPQYSLLQSSRDASIAEANFLAILEIQLVADGKRVRVRVKRSGISGDRYTVTKNSRPLAAGEYDLLWHGMYCTRGLGKRFPPPPCTFVW